MQTNLSVQIMQTSILVTRLWSKGALKEGGRRDLQKQEVICKGWLEALLQITPHTFRPLGSTSCSPDWSLYSLHREIGLHMILRLDVEPARLGSAWLEPAR